MKRKSEFAQRETNLCRGTQRHFLSDPLKRYFSLSGVPLKLYRFILGSAIIFLSVRSF